MNTSARAAIRVVVSLVALLTSASGAFACTCMGAGPVCQAYWKTDAVFDATVEGINPSSRQDELGGRSFTFPEKIVHLNIRQAWKDVPAGPLDIVTAADGAACGYDFKPGKRYLVFAQQRTTDGRWAVSLCNSTTEFDGTGEASDFLASLAAAPKGARIYGSIKSRAPTFDPSRGPVEQRVETRVRLLGGGQERVVTSTGGKFQFAGLTTGTYRLVVDMPDGYTTWQSERTVDIVDERACAQVDYYLAPSGRITGRLVNAQDRPMSGLRIEARPADTRNQPGGMSLPSGFSGQEGAFEITDLPPGRYIVGLNLDDAPPSQYRPYARTIYPSDGSDGMIITIDRGHAYDLGDWRLPPPVPTVRLDGVVVWEEGTPAAGIVVGAMDITVNPRGGFVANATTAADGRFTIELRQPRVYTFVLSAKSGGRLPFSPPRLETGSSPPTPIRIVILGKPQ